jgi:hypothetical protein
MWESGEEGRPRRKKSKCKGLEPQRQIILGISEKYQ